MIKIEKINRWFENQGRNIIKYRWPILFSYVLVIVLSINGIKKLEIESSWENFFLEDDPVLVKSEQFKDIFGNDNYVAVMTESQNTYSTQSLKLIRELSNELMDSVSYAEKITSLTDIEFMVGTEDGMYIDQLVPEKIPTTSEELNDIKAKVESKPKVAERLVSKNGKQSWILLKLRNFPEEETSADGMKISPEMLTGGEVEKILSQKKYEPIAPKATGMPYLTYRKQIFYGKEASTIMGLALLLAIIVLLLTTRSLRGLVIPLVTSVSSIIIVYGFLGYIGYVIDSGMISIPILLSLAVAIAYNIHVFTFFKREFRIHGERRKAVVDAVGEMGWPILFSALTTTGALLTFLVIPMRPLRFVGFATAGCVMITFLIVITLMPALLSFGRNKKASKERVHHHVSGLERYLEMLGSMVVKYPKRIISVSTILLVVLGIGAFKVESAFDIEKTMGRKVPYIKDILHISESELGSLYAYDLLIEFSEDGAAKKSINLLKLEKISQFTDSLPLTKRTTSILNVVKDLNQTLNQNQQKYYQIPNKDNQVAQMLLLYENSGGTESEYWMDYDYRRLRLMVELSNYNSGEAEKELLQIEDRAHKLFPNAKVTVVGNLPQFTRMMQYVVKGQVQSFAMAMIIIFILLSLVFGSFRIGLIGLIPNITPAITVGGVMGWMGIPLDMMTATIIPMILGLAVDDTIHFINHGHLEFNKDRHYDRTIVKTFKSVGVALVLTTLVISSNFIVYTTSAANQFINLGILAVIGMTSALISDLFITPVLFKWFKIYGKQI